MSEQLEEIYYATVDEYGNDDWSQGDTTPLSVSACASEDDWDGTPGS